jgi:hypothetical protein
MTAVRKEEEDDVGKSSPKLEEIMESFNSYKLNKEKFITSLKHTRTETEPIGKYVRETAKIDEPLPSQETSRLFNQIDNIWNEDVKVEEKTPQFQRSHRPKYGLEELTDILNETIEFQENAP